MPTYVGATDDVLTVDREIVDPKAVAFELKLELMSPWLDARSRPVMIQHIVAGEHQDVTQ